MTARIASSKSLGKGASNFTNSFVRGWRKPSFQASSSVKVPPKRIPYFKPGKELRELLNDEC